MKAQRFMAVRLALACMALSLLSACMYGNEIKRQGAPASAEYVALVQSAMEQYQKKTGVLPVRNKEEGTPLYEKYYVDFNKLKAAHLMTAVPTNAFENGGTAVYVIVHMETKPQVKLMDLVSYQQVALLQAAADRYAAAHNGDLAKGDEVASGVWALDFAKLKRKPEQVLSPYSRQYLGVIIDRSGTVSIDYGPDIVRVIQKNASAPDSAADLRELLVAEGYFVPARSLPYRWQDGKPVPVPEANSR